MKKLTTPIELAGKTVRAVFDEHHGSGMVIVFEDDDWCVLSIENEMSPDESVGINYFSGKYDTDIKNFLSPDDLLEARLLTKAQYDYLTEQNKKADAERKRKSAAQLLAEAERLEGEAR